MKRTHLSIALAVLLATAAACGSDSDSSDGGGTAAPPDTSAAATTPDTEATESSAAPSEPAPSGGLDVDAVLAADLDNCAPEPTGEPLKLGYAADLSDLGGFADAPASAAAEHFVNLINCVGGVDGVPVELTIQNIEGDPEVTARAAQDLLDAGVSAILGPPFADFGQPLLQVTQGNVPVLFVASTEPTLGDVGALSYLTAFDDTAQATAAAEFALDQGWTTAVTFSSPGPYFGYNPEVFTEVFEEGGGTILGDYNYVPLDDTDFSTQVNEIANLDEQPAVVYSAMLASQGVQLAAQLEAAGVDTTMLMADAFEATGGYVTEGTDGFFATTHAFSEPGNRVAALDESFAAATGAPLGNPSFGSLAADAILVLIAAYQAAGTTDGAELGAAIADVDIDGITGRLSYGGEAIPTKPVFITEMVDGQPTLAATIG
jgi:branched-chain amino acid transport system substrate-binding protein